MARAFALSAKVEALAILLSRNSFLSFSLHAISRRAAVLLYDSHLCGILFLFVLLFATILRTVAHFTLEILDPALWLYCIMTVTWD